MIGAVGFNLTTLEMTHIGPREVRLISTRFAFQILHGLVSQILPRSLHAKAGISTDGGVIDSDYRRLIYVIMINQNTSIEIMINEGDRFMQIIFHQIYTGTLQEIKDITTTVYRHEGFGSMGVKAI